MEKLRRIIMLAFFASISIWGYATSPSPPSIDGGNLLIYLEDSNGPAKVIQSLDGSDNTIMDFELRTGKFWTNEQFDVYKARWISEFPEIANSDTDPLISYDETTRVVHVVWKKQNMDQIDKTFLDNFFAYFGFESYAVSGE